MGRDLHISEAERSKLSDREEVRLRVRLALADFYVWTNVYADHGTALRLADEWLAGQTTVDALAAMRAPDER